VPSLSQSEKYHNWYTSLDMDSTPFVIFVVSGHYLLTSKHCALPRWRRRLEFGITAEFRPHSMMRKHKLL